MNVLFVKTHKSNGRAWAAWKVTEAAASRIEYVVSINGKEVTVYAVNDFVMGKFFGNDYDRAAFDLTDITKTNVANKIVNLYNSDLFSTGWTIKFGYID